MTRSGRRVFDPHDRFGGGAGLAADLEVHLVIDQLRETLPRNRVVFDQEDPPFSGPLGVARLVPAAGSVIGRHNELR